MTSTTTGTSTASAGTPSTSTSQPPLLPTLFALLPQESYAQVVSSISLRSIHAESYATHDKLYRNAHSVVPGQHRILRLRGTRRPRSAVSGHKSTYPSTVPPSGELGSAVEESEKKDEKGKGKDEGKEMENFRLAYLSSQLSGREYAQANVRAIVELEVRGMDERDQVEDFISTLGFAFSHEYKRSGTLFHLPLPHPNLTLHLTITRLSLTSDSPDQSSTASSEPWVVQLYPAKPISGVASRSELGLSEVIDLMTGTARRIDGLEWGTGRPQ